MFCPRCGRENDDRERMCRGCKAFIPSHFSAKIMPSPVLIAELQGFALISLFLGIFAFMICSEWICFLPAIAAVLTGHTSLGTFGPNSIPGRIIAIIGLVLGYGLLFILFLANITFRN